MTRPLGPATTNITQAPGGRRTESKPRVDSSREEVSCVCRVTDDTKESRGDLRPRAGLGPAPPNPTPEDPGGAKAAYDRAQQHQENQNPDLRNRFRGWKTILRSRRGERPGEKGRRFDARVSQRATMPRTRNMYIPVSLESGRNGKD